MFQKRKKLIGWFVVAASLAATKLWLVGAQSLYVQADSIYDDRLFLNLAQNLRNGDWLGIYNHMTLVKGIIFPLWISLVSSFRIPILTAQHVLYIGMCFLFCHAIGQVVKNDWAEVILFTLLIFNPMSYSVYVMPVVQREGIYPALTLFLLASLLLTSQSYPESLWTQVLRGFLFGVALALFWMTREEGLWLIPAMAIILIGITWNYIRNRNSFNNFPFSPGIGLGVALCCFLVVCWINLQKYGVFTLNEMKTDPFKNTYLSMLHIQDETKSLITPVPEGTRKLLYMTSPRFSELKAYFTAVEKEKEYLLRFHMENYGVNPDYTQFIDYFIKHLPEEDIWKKSFESGSFYDDINGALFVWIFRDAVATAGHHQSARDAAQYYRQLADDIRSACEQEKIDCNNHRIPFIPRMTSIHIPLLVEAMLSGLTYLSNFEGFTTEILPSEGAQASLAFAQKILREKLVPVTLYLDGRIFISPDKTFNLEIVDHKGTRRNRSILLRRDDSGNAADAFFSLETRCINDCYLTLPDSGGTMLRFPLDELTGAIQNSSMPLQIDRMEYRHGNAQDVFRLSILDKIGYMYQIVFSFAGPLALLFFLYEITQAVLYHRKIGLYEIIWIALFLGLLSRIVVLSVVHITSFPAIISRYFAPIYPMYIAFVFLSFFRLIQSFTSPDRHLYPERAG